MMHIALTVCFERAVFLKKILDFIPFPQSYWINFILCKRLTDLNCKIRLSVKLSHLSSKAHPPNAQPTQCALKISEIVEFLEGIVFFFKNDPVQFKFYKGTSDKNDLNCSQKRYQFVICNINIVVFSQKTWTWRSEMIGMLKCQILQSTVDEIFFYFSLHCLMDTTLSITPKVIVVRIDSVFCEWCSVSKCIMSTS